MDRTTGRGQAVLMDTYGAVPRWLTTLSLSVMGVLLAVVVILVLGFVTAGPEENLAGVLLILAAVIAAPLGVAVLLWSAGHALRRRSPGPAVALVVASALVGGLVLLLVALSFVPFG